MFLIFNFTAYLDQAVAFVFFVVGAVHVWFWAAKGTLFFFLLFQGLYRFLPVIPCPCFGSQGLSHL